MLTINSIIEPPMVIDGQMGSMARHATGMTMHNTIRHAHNGMLCRAEHKVSIISKRVIKACVIRKV